MPETSEQALFKAACEGDEDAYEALQRRLEPVIRRFVRRISGGHYAEDDIVQDTFIRFYRNMHRIQPPSHLRPYLYRIARNRCYDELRQEQKQDWLSLDDEPVELYVSFNQGNRNQLDNTAHWILLHMEVREAIDRLSPPQREALILFSEEGLSYSE
ncbi:MAG: RNA polymerase sigma factor, partial [Chloroflexi bacterium]